MDTLENNRVSRKRLAAACSPSLPYDLGVDLCDPKTIIVCVSQQHGTHVPFSRILLTVFNNDGNSNNKIKRKSVISANTMPSSLFDFKDQTTNDVKQDTRQEI